jgi:hypothetical protein
VRDAERSVDASHRRRRVTGIRVAGVAGQARELRRRVTDRLDPLRDPVAAIEHLSVEARDRLAVADPAHVGVGRRRAAQLVEHRLERHERRVGHRQRHTVRSQRIAQAPVRVAVKPLAVAHLKRPARPRGQLADECDERVDLGRPEVRRHLDQDRFELLLKRQRAGNELIDQAARADQAVLVGDLARQLEREGESRGNLRGPAAYAFGRRRTVERRVDLDAAELLGVLAQVPLGSRSGVVHRTDPVRIRPALRPEGEMREVQPFPLSPTSSIVTLFITSPARIWSTTF